MLVYTFRFGDIQAQVCALENGTKAENCAIRKTQ